MSSVCLVILRIHNLHENCQLIQMCAKIAQLNFKNTSQPPRVYTLKEFCTIEFQKDTLRLTCRKYLNGCAPHSL